MFYEIMNDESLASLSKFSTKVFGKCAAAVTKLPPWKLFFVYNFSL